MAKWDASRVKHKHLEKVFYAVPKMVGRKFKYAQVDADTKSRELKEALELLEKAGLVYRIKKTSGQGLPFEADADDRYFTVLFLDIGLMQNLCGISAESLLREDPMKINVGALAEQLVGQELIGTQGCYQIPQLYYWARQARNSSAEVDYLVALESTVVPLEVKSGKTGTLRSMHLFLEKYKATRGIKLSQAPFTVNPPIVSIPLYLTGQIPNLLAEQ